MHHINTFFVLTGSVGYLIHLVAPANNRQRERRFFWTGYVIVAISAFFIAYPPDANSGLLWFAFASFLMLSRGYMMTSNIKIGEKIYAYHLDDKRPDPPAVQSAAADNAAPDYDPEPDSYNGTITATKMWISLIVMTAICTVNIVVYFESKERPILTLIMALVLVALSAGFGYGDSIWGYPIARRQLIQFSIISIISVGVFPMLYFAGYLAGKHWPWRNKHSMEYRAHPRHQKEWP